jgi:hypothetical protein
MSGTKDYGWSDDSDVTLLAKLRSDLKTAMLRRDSGVKDTIRQVISEFPKLTVPLVLESGKKTTRLKKDDEITNDDIVDIIRGLVKSERTVLELKKEETSEYLETLELYLPKMAERDTVKAWIMENVDFTAVKSPMQAMGPIMKHFGKTADGNMVKDILQEIAG